MASPAKASPQAARRRLSHPSLAFSSSYPSASSSSSSYLPLSLPSVSGLHGALLGYLGEVEIALRQKLGAAADANAAYQMGLSPDGHLSASSSPSSEEDTDLDEVLATSSSRAPTNNANLRNRYNQNGPASPEALGSTTPCSTSKEEDEMVLNYLSALRDDISNYVPSMPDLSSQREWLRERRGWLRSLPMKLHALDLGLQRGGDGDTDAAWADPLGRSRRAVSGARRRVINLVHVLLPPDDWAGWESLGWEEDEGEDEPDGVEVPRKLAHSKSASFDVSHARPTFLDDDDDEPEYLFPNRTPGPAEARHRVGRSRSVGDADYQYHLPPFLDQFLHPAEIADVVDDEGEALDQSAIDAALSGPEEQVDLEKKLLEAVIAEEIIADCPTIAEALEMSKDGSILLKYSQMPFWWRNNQYIHTGYRFIPLGRSGPIPLIKSAFSVHNETINIHSHSIPTLVILGIIPFIWWNSPLPNAHWLDTAVLIAYLVAAMSCLSSSASWHVLSGCANRRWFEWGACVDYIGISWLIAMSFNTVVYNAYYCHPQAAVGYTLTNIAFGALGSYLPFQKWFNQRKYKHYRIAFFLALNAAMFAPMVQLFWHEGFERASAFVAPFFVSVLAYVLGLLCYAFHWPECVWPGKFDLYGASHQLWHTAIVAAIVLHFRASLMAHDQRLEYSCAAPDAGPPVTEAVTRLLFGHA